MNDKQLLSHDTFMRAFTQEEKSSTDCGPGVGRLKLLLGKGGCGKSFTFDTMITSVDNLHGNDASKEMMVMATTGKAACGIGGSTVHSYKEGIGLPCGMGDTSFRI